MFSVTPVPENKERRVSFSPDIDQSYRHHVVDKIRNLMDEVQVGQPKKFNLQRKGQINLYSNWRSQYKSKIMGKGITKVKKNEKGRQK